MESRAVSESRHWKNEKEVNTSEIWYMRERDASGLEGKEQPGPSAPDGRRGRQGLTQRSITQVLPHRMTRSGKMSSWLMRKTALPPCRQRLQTIGCRRGWAWGWSRTSADGWQKQTGLAWANRKACCGWPAWLGASYGSGDIMVALRSRGARRECSKNSEGSTVRHEAGTVKDRSSSEANMEGMEKA